MAEAVSKKGKLIVISGPSGVGKGTICAEVCRRLPSVYINVSATTRPKAASEVNGREYWFVSAAEFEGLKKDGKLLEYAEVFGNMYGTPREGVDRALSEGKTVILEIDVQGGRSVKSVYPEAVSIFILPPDTKELERRLEGRGRETIEAAQRRLQKAGKEMGEAEKFYDYKVVNDNLEKAIQRVIGIISNIDGEKR
jgi:guanylate kinase